MPQRRLIVAITGASGAVYGVRLLELLRESGVDSHLLVTPAGWLNIDILERAEPDLVLVLEKAMQQAQRIRGY